MRNLLIGFVLMLGAVAPIYAWADNTTVAQSASSARNAFGSEQLRALLERFEISPIAKAYAADCKDEGEICKTNADCCSGLECSGDPQTTCRPEE
jgi:hypothetical protein